MARTLTTKHLDAIDGLVAAPIALIHFETPTGDSYLTTFNESVSYNSQTYLGGTVAIKLLSLNQDTTERGGTARIEWPLATSTSKAVVRSEGFIGSNVYIYKTVAYETLLIDDAELLLSGIVYKRDLNNGKATIDVRSKIDTETYPVDFITEGEDWPYVGKEGTYSLGGRTFTDVLQ